MTVTKTTHVLNAPWTETQLLDDLIKPAFITAGLIASDWYDSFTTTGGGGGGTNTNIINTPGVSYPVRILRLSYDNAKTHGNTHIAFSASTYSSHTNLAIRLTSSDWDLATNTPNGQGNGLDWSGTFKLVPRFNGDNTTASYVPYFPPYSTSASFGVSGYTSIAHGAFVSPITSTGTVVADVYKSSLNPDFSVIRVSGAGFNNGTPMMWTFIAPGMSLPGWIDLDKVNMNPMLHITESGNGTSSNATLAMRSVSRLRRSALHSGVDTTSSEAALQSSPIEEFRYTSCSAGVEAMGAIPIPSFYGSATVNPAFTNNVAPIVTGLPMSMLTTDPWPADFGFWAPFGTTTYDNGDTLAITAGSNEWEVIDGVALPTDSAASLLLLARVV